MGVYIKGMEMPTSCWDCYFQDCGNCILNAHKVVDKCILDGCRDADCPLVTVPPHGRLIDADELCKTIIYAKADDFLKAGVIAYVKAADTIMEAEERGQLVARDMHGRPHYDRTQTNADRIRAMSDEKLAEWFVEVAGWLPMYENKAHPILKWLKQEVDNEQP